MNAFERLAPFIQDYIYRNEWEELRGGQVAACEVIFDTDDNRHGFRKNRGGISSGAYRAL